MTISRRKFVSFSSASILTISALPALAGPRYLSGKEITALFSGKTVDYWGKTNGASTYAGNTISTMDSTYGQLMGTWSVRGRKYCRAFGSGPMSCNKIRDNADGTYSFQDYTFSVR